jgi:biotin carboxylase
VSGVDTFLVLGGGGPNGHTADWSRRIVAAARRCGYRLHIADRPVNLVTVPAGDPVIAVHPVDYKDVDGCLALARSLDPGDGTFAVVGFREFSLLSAAVAAQAVGSPWNDPVDVARTRDKYACRERLRERGFWQPECHLLADPAEAVALVRSGTGRWVVKPRDAFGSEGVTAVDAPGGDVLATAVDWAFSYSTHAIVEEFVAGPEFSAEGIFLGGVPHLLGLTEKTTTTPPYFVEVGHVQPPALPVDESEVASTVCSAVLAAGLRHSLFHVEFWLSPRGIVLGEVHGRGGGDWIHALIDFRYGGFDQFEAVLNDTAGRPVSLPEPDPHRAAAVAALGAPATGRVRSVGGVDAALQDPDVIAVDIRIGPGDEVTSGLVDSFSRVGMAVGGGKTPEQARENVRRLAANVVVEVQ